MAGKGRSQTTRRKGIRRPNISQRLTPDSPPLSVTPHFIFTVPHSSSSVLDTLSRIPMDSQTLVAPTELVSSTTTNDDTSTQKGMSWYVRHTGGSKRFRTHTHQLANEYGKRPSNLELFEKLWKKNRDEGDRCDARSK